MTAPRPSTSRPVEGRARAVDVDGEDALRGCAINARERGSKRSKLRASKRHVLELALKRRHVPHLVLVPLERPHERLRSQLRGFHRVRLRRELKLGLDRLPIRRRVLRVRIRLPPLRRLALVRLRRLDREAEQPRLAGRVLGHERSERALAPPDDAHALVVKHHREHGVLVREEVVELAPHRVVPVLPRQPNLPPLPGRHLHDVLLAAEHPLLVPDHLLEVFPASRRELDHPRRPGLVPAVRHDRTRHLLRVRHRLQAPADDVLHELLHPGQRHEVDPGRDRQPKVQERELVEQGYVHRAQARELVHERVEVQPYSRLQLHVVEADRYSNAEDLEHGVFAVGAVRLRAADDERRRPERDLLESDPVHEGRHHRSEHGLDAVADALRRRGVQSGPEAVDGLVQPRRARVVRLFRPLREVLQGDFHHLFWESGVGFLVAAVAVAVVAAAGVLLLQLLQLLRGSRQLLRGSLQLLGRRRRLRPRLAREASASDEEHAEDEPDARPQDEDAPGVVRVPRDRRERANRAVRRVAREAHRGVEHGEVDQRRGPGGRRGSGRPHGDRRARHNSAGARSIVQCASTRIRRVPYKNSSPAS
eukprot:31564-Pelagococcus_subviridis.AAC.8